MAAEQPAACGACDPAARATSVPALTPRLSLAEFELSIERAGVSIGTPLLWNTSSTEYSLDLGLMGLPDGEHLLRLGVSHNATTIVDTSAPTKPSHVFFGESEKNGCAMNRLPSKAPHA